MKKKLLALALALCMVISLMPVTALATEDDGINTDEELREAVSAAQSGDTITLTGNISGLNERVIIEKNLTINLGNYVISGDANHFITVKNGAKVTLNAAEGGGVKTSKRNSVTVAGSASVTITGGNYVGAIYNQKAGDITLNNVTVTATEFETGNSSYAVYAQEGGKITINGGSYTNKVEIDYKDTAIVACGGAEIVINDAIVYGEYALGCHAECGCTTSGKITVNGGNFEGTKGLVYTDNLANPDVTIYGGTFSADPSAYVADNYYAVHNEDNTYTVSVGVNTEQELRDAVSAAQSGDTITLTGNISGLNERVIIEKNLTINLGNYVISGDANHFITVKNGAKVTLNATEGGIKTSKRNSVTVAGGASVTINGGNYVGAIYNQKAGDITLNNVTVTATEFETGNSSYAVYAQEGGKITINGGSYTNNIRIGYKDTAVVACGGAEIVINDATVNGEYALGCHAECGCTTSGKITVNGGNFTGTEGLVYTDNLDNPDVTIYGGTFSADPSAYVAPYYEAKDNGNGTFTVSKRTSYEFWVLYDKDDETHSSLIGRVSYVMKDSEGNVVEQTIDDGDEYYVVKFVLDGEKDYTLTASRAGYVDMEVTTGSQTANGITFKEDGLTNGFTGLAVYTDWTVKEYIVNVTTDPEDATIVFTDTDGNVIEGNPFEREMGLYDENGEPVLGEDGEQETVLVKGTEYWLRVDKEYTWYAIKDGYEKSEVMDTRELAKQLSMFEGLTLSEYAKKYNTAFIWSFWTLELEEISTPATPSYPTYPSVPSTPSVDEEEEEENEPVVETEKVENEDGSVTETTTTTEKTENEDGTVSETVTVVETTENTDGSTVTSEVVTETITNEDGTTETVTTETLTTELADGTTATTVTDSTGAVTSEITLSEEAVENDIVSLPIPEVSASDSESAATVTISLPETEETTTVTVEIPVSDVDENSVVVIVLEDGTEEIVQKTSLTENGLSFEVSENVTIKVIDNSREFDDVDDDDWYNRAVEFTSSRGILNGMGDGEFSPETNMTRGQLAQMLYALESSPDVESAGSFADASGEWYETAVDWAAQNNIIAGLEDGSFGGGEEMTREQLVTFLYRYAGKPASEASDKEFSDTDSVSSWAQDAMNWAVSNGIINGMDGAINPQGTATRGQVAQVLMSFINNCL